MATLGGWLAEQGATLGELRSGASPGGHLHRAGRRARGGRSGARRAADRGRAGARPTVRALPPRWRAEISMTLRRGESLLLTLGIPLLLLVFFCQVKCHLLGADVPSIW